MQRSSEVLGGQGPLVRASSEQPHPSLTPAPSSALRPSCATDPLCELRHRAAPQPRRSDPPPLPRRSALLRRAAIELCRTALDNLCEDIKSNATNRRFPFNLSVLSDRMKASHATSLARH